MNKPLPTLALIMLLLSCWACERPTPPTVSNAAAPSPATRPAATGPADLAPPPTSMLKIDGRDVLFPPAKLRLEPRDGALWARLFTAEPPKNVPDEPFLHNSYYFDMRLDVPDADQLPAAVWTHKAASSERADSPNGIFLRDLQDHLQPYDVRVQFSRQGPDTLVQITGHFLLFHENAIQPQLLLIDGSVQAATQAK